VKERPNRPPAIKPGQAPSLPLPVHFFFTWITIARTNASMVC
jgi:hypothetical protein